MTCWRNRRWTWVLLCALWVGGMTAWDARAAPPCLPQWRKLIRLELRDQPILEVVKKISDLTCYHFIVADQVRGRKITLIAEKAVSVRDVYSAFLSMLEVNELTLVKEGAYRRIVFSRQALQQPIPYSQGKFREAAQDQLVMYMLTVKHIDVFQLNNVLRQLASPAGRTIVFQPSSIILLVDYANNIQRLLKIVNELDVAEANVRERMYIVQILNGQAQEIVQRVQAIFQVQQIQPNQRRFGSNQIDENYRLSKIIADERTNRVIIVSGPMAFANVRGLLDKLDISLPDGGQVRLTRLRFAKADEIAQTLSQLAQGRSPMRGRAPIRASSTDLFQGEIRITPDKATNSLVIVANQRDYESLMRVIKQLDVRRKQIFIEAVIMEVSLEKTRELGAAFHGGLPLSTDTTNPSFALLGTRLSGLTSLVLDPASLMGLALGLRGPPLAGTSGLLGTGTSIPSFGVVLRAMQTNSDVDLISTPHVLATTNEEATLQVGQNVPFIAGTNFSSIGMGVGFPVQNIQRQDVALTLKLKPQVNAGDRVKIEIDLELTEIASQNRELGPTTTKRKIKTTVRVRDNQTIVIGGLIRDRQAKGVSKVPVLGDIPLLGALFRVEQNSTEKRNLLIFMTPHIVLTASDFRKIFQQKMRERQEFLDAYYTEKYKELRDSAKLRSTGVLDHVFRDHEYVESRAAREQQKKREAQKQKESQKELPRAQQVSPSKAPSPRD
ncbi:type II secretion system secretin GspD [Myxococcota bacterium]|nr:type II secretion system secretin GspD [Myxococcota bacterium]